MKARIEVLEFLNKTNNTAMTRSLPDTTHIQQTTVCVVLLLGGSLTVSLSEKPMDIAST
jgi:hypothetical protein